MEEGLNPASPADEHLFFFFFFWLFIPHGKVSVLNKDGGGVVPL